MGAKKKPFYRINVTEKRTKRDGSFVEIVGYYDPCRNPAEIKIDRERLNYWTRFRVNDGAFVHSLHSASSRLRHQRRGKWAYERRFIEGSRRDHC